jgi:hypothetical protein
MKMGMESHLVSNITNNESILVHSKLQDWHDKQFSVQDRRTYYCYHLLGYGAVWSECEPTFRSNVSPPSSGLKISWERN